MNIWNGWLNSPEWLHVIQTLLHSLWQAGLLALLLTALCRKITGPTWRYRLALGALAALLGLSLLTWSILEQPAPSLARAQNPPRSETVPLSAPGLASSTSPVSASSRLDEPSPARVVAPSPWIPWLSAAWLAGALLMLARAGAQLAGAEKLRLAAAPLQDPRLQQLLTQAQDALRMSRRIKIAVIDQMTSPAVAGILAPTLILPLSLLTTLTPEQIRFVLLHELAHIRRGDYLANVFQLLMESLFFFNPGAWWISRQVRREREACCDGLAAAFCETPADYARTLVQVAEAALNAMPGAAPAFGGDNDRSSLTERIQRLVVPGYRPVLRLTWPALLAALLAGSGLLFLSALGARLTVGAILSPQERMDRIEKKMAEYGQSPRAHGASLNEEGDQVEILGQVASPNGVPVQSRRWINIYHSQQNSSTLKTARLESNGVFRSQVPLGSFVAVAMNEPGFAPAIAGPLRVKTSAPMTNLNLVLHPGFDARISLTDAADGKPIAGARLHAEFWIPEIAMSLGPNFELQTDSNGVCLMKNCSDAVVLALTINAPGYELAEHRFSKLEPGKPLQIALPRGGSLSGLVLEKFTGQPIAGAILRMIHEHHPNPRRYEWTNPLRILAVSDASGRFNINQLRPGVKYWLGVAAAGRESALAGPVAAGDPLQPIRLGPELIVRGRVLGSLDGLQIIDGAPCLSRNFSEVMADHSYGFHEWTPIRLEDGVARFEFTNRVAGLVKLSGRQGFHEERTVTSPVDDWVVDLNDAKTQLVRNPPKREVIFRFTHPSAVSPRGTVAVMVPENLDPKHRTARIVEKEVLNGEVRIEIPVGGQTQVEPKRLIGFWFKPPDLFLVTNGTGPLLMEIPCVAAGAIYAAARNPDNTPAGGLHFGVKELNPPPNRGSAISAGASDGFSGNAPRQWVSGPLPLGGAYQVYAWRGNSFCVSNPISLTEANPDAEVELRFAPGKDLRGIILNDRGQPLPGVELKPSFTLSIGHGFGLNSIVTDQHGRFQLSEATPGVGDFFVEAKAPGWKAERFQLKFQAAPQTFRLQRGRSLAGRVVQAGTGLGIPGMEIRAFAPGEPDLPMIAARTEAGGYFSFTSLGNAAYTLYPDGGQLLDASPFPANGATNLVLQVKLYDWSTLTPGP